jgi:transposase-like protein
MCDKTILVCKHCGGSRLNKNGRQGGKQRYLCRDCNRTFREGKDNRVKEIDERMLRVLKHYRENMGIRSIGRTEGIHNTTVLSWLRKMGKILKNKLEETVSRVNNDISFKRENIEILEIDEIVTTVKKKLKMGGNIPLFGLLLIGKEVKLLILKTRTSQ